jgi:hypothetical protein
MSSKVYENPAVVSVFNSSAVVYGAYGIKGWFAWSRKEDERPLVKVILRAAEELAQCDEDLRRQAAGITRDLNTMVQALDAGHTINSAGVLQRGPVELDMLAQRRMLLVEHLKSLLWAYTEGAK